MGSNKMLKDLDRQVKSLTDQLKDIKSLLKIAEKY